jgi:plasmid stabilization system protein ParE
VTANLIVRQEAEADIADAYRWYEAQQPGLGHDFLDAVESVFERIAEQPLRYAPIHRDTRRTFLRRFPYVAFHVLRDESVHVIAVLHHRRSPRLLRRRTSHFEGG